MSQHHFVRYEAYTDFITIETAGDLQLDHGLSSDSTSQLVTEVRAASRCGSGPPVSRFCDGDFNVAADGYMTGD
jgi:hypothetical protein